MLTPYKGQSYSIESKEAPWSKEGSGYPMGLQEGYYPSTPSDTLTPFRNECVNILNKDFRGASATTTTTRLPLRGSARST